MIGTNAVSKKVYTAVEGIQIHFGALHIGWNLVDLTLRPVEVARSRTQGAEWKVWAQGAMGWVLPSS